MCRATPRPRLKPGDRFSRLELIECVGKINRVKKWKCRCECGTVSIVYANSLANGHTKSCGCLKKEKAIEIGRRAIHGEATRSRYSTEYQAWRNLKQRCLNSKYRDYHNYGGRGIKVCDRWKESFTNFLQDMGKKPFKEYSLDRIDVNGDYTPANCRWTSSKEQMANRRINLYVPPHMDYVWDVPNINTKYLEEYL